MTGVCRYIWEDFFYEKELEENKACACCGRMHDVACGMWQTKRRK